MYYSIFSMLGNRRFSSPVVAFSSQSLSRLVVDPDDATCELSFNNDRTITKTADEPLAETSWLSGDVASNYDIRVTPTSGTYSSGSASTGTWLNLGTNRSWNVVRTSPGPAKACTATFEIRMAASPFTVLDTETITLTAHVEAA